MPKDISYIISKINQLPTFPHIAQEITRKTADPNVSTDAISELIACDPSVSSKVLKTTNSAQYGFSKPVTDINRAIVALGLDAVKDIAVSIAVFDSFTHKGNSGVFNRIDFWEHSLAVAIACEVIGKITRYPNPGELFLTGLLHDLGKIVLDIYTPEDFSEAIDICKEENILLFESEKRVYGFTHSDAGMWLAEKWSLQENIKEAIGCHHNPTPTMIDVDFEMTGIVHISDILVRSLMLGNGGDNKIPLLHNEVRGLFEKIVNNDLTKCFEQIWSSFQKSKALFALD